MDWKETLGWGEDELEDLRFIGYSYVKQGKYDVAIHFFEALSIISPNTPYDLQTLGALHLETGNNLAALNFFEKALKLEPNHAQTLLNRTKALLALGYKRQGLAQAKSLEQNSDRQIASQAGALLLAYT